jgi:hypothetical protein
MRPGLLATLLLLVAALPARAALPAVSGTPDPAVDEVPADGAPEGVAYSLANGFPLWYRDANGLKLALCDDQVAEFAPGVPSHPCLTAEPFPSAPRSFPLNFGGEALYWTASSFRAFASSSTVGGVLQLFLSDVLVVLSLEASFQNLIPIDGDQATFARIRIRANLPQPGTYLVTHPYGEVTYVVVGAAEREIDQTQDIGNMPPHVVGAPVPPGGPPPRGDFTLALRDGPEPPPGPFDPAIDAGVISTVATGIGPFLRPAATPGGAPLDPLLASSGALYLADPGNDLPPPATGPLTVPVTGSPLGADRNAFTITLLDPPEGFFLNAEEGTQTVVFDRFQVAGKIFDDGPNAAPLAAPDAAATAPGVPVAIDVLANDLDVVDPIANRHGIHPQAIGLPSNDPADLPGTILLTRPLTTPNGGIVRRSTTFTTGETVLVYTPAPGFAGTDVFEYVVQDTGGRVSAPATVTVLVEDVVVSRADVRPRNGKWDIRGTTSATDANEVALFASPRALLSGAGVVPPAASGARGAATFAVRPGEIEFRLRLDRAPASAITAAHLHLGLPGENGPAVLFLFDEVVDGPFTGAKAAVLGPARLLFVPARPSLTFEEVQAAVLAGAAYVDVHTVALAAGELRGQVTAPLIGTAPVDATGAFAFTGRSRASPGGLPATVTAVSSHGIRAATVPLRFR